MVKEKSRKTFFVLLCSVLFASCNFDQPVKQWFDYWTSTCQVGKIEYASENTYLNGEPNLYAKDSVEINLYTINPQKFALLKKPDNGRCFTFKNEDGDILSDYEETMVDPTWIKIRANLPDEWEGKKITLSGCLWPENRSGFTEEELKTQSPELFYSTTFIQNTPPDNVKNMKASGEGDFFPGTNMHYLYFDVPDQSLCRHKGCSFEVKYYLLDTDGTYYYKGIKILTLDDDKNPGDGTGFSWYFDEQEPYLFYDYTVQVLGPHGLKSETLATSESLGVHQLREPELTITDEPNGLFDEEGFECFEIASDSDSISYTSFVADAGDLLTVTVDGSVVTGTDGVYTLGGIAQHTIVATSSKDGSRPISVVKKIRIVKALPEPQIEFTNASSIDGDTVKFSYLNYENLLMDITNTYQGDDSTFTSVIDGKPKSGNVSGEELSVGRHKIEISLTKPYCVPIEIEKTIDVKIKPVYVAFENNSFQFHGADDEGGDSIDLRGTLCAETEHTGKRNLYTKSSGEVSKDPFFVTKVYETFILQSPKDTFYFYSDGPLNDKDGKKLHPIGNLPKGSGSSTRTLEELKKNKYFFQVGGRAEGYFNCTFTLVLSELPSATFSFTPALNGLFDGADYECVEVNNAADTVAYTISCLESGVSLSGTVDSSSFSGTKTGTLGLGTHTLVAKTAASGSGNSTVTRKINVVQKLQEPVIKFYKESSHTNEIASTNDNAESDMKYKLYSNYNIGLDKDGNGQLYYAVSAESGTTVTVEETTINGDEETVTAITSGSLPLGPHILTFTVSKDGNTPVSVEKKVYVQGILSEPVITSSNGTFVSGSGGIKDNKVDPMVWKFSYLNYDSLKCKVNPGNKDNDVALYGVLNGKDVSLGDPTKNIGIEADNAYQLKIVQKRQYCKTLTTTKYVKGIIKPITLVYNNESDESPAYMCISRYDGKGKFNVLGTIYVNGATIWGWGQQDDRNNISAQSWADLGYGKAKDGKTENAKRSVSVTCTSPNDDVTILAENMRRRNGSAMGDKSQSRTLSEIKSTTEIPASGGAVKRTVPGWTLWSGELTDNTHYVYIYVTFKVSEAP